MEDKLFEDIFRVIDVDPDGKKFDKVSRFQCRGTVLEMNLLLDINVDLYHLHADDEFTMALARTLNQDGEADDGLFDPALGTDARPSLMDSFDYVMYGRVFEYEVSPQDMKLSVCASFGGLLMQLSGDENNLKKINPDMRLYLLIRKN